MRPIHFLALSILLAACGVGPAATAEPTGGERGPAYLDHYEVLILESFPVQLVLYVEGDLPTPCHELVWEVGAADSEGRIEVDLYSEADPDVACIQVLEEFEVRIPLGSYTSGHYAIWLNGELAAEVALP
jgi:hypothetical protein